MRMDPALAVTSRSVDAGVPSPSTESGVAESGTPETRRVRAVSAFLLDHPPLLLPLASHFREPQLIFESGPQPCQPGDVVFYLADDGYIVHRVVYRARRGSAPDYLLTCGDNRLAPDPPVQGNQVLGTVIAVQNARYWQPPSPPTTAPFYKRMIRAITLTAMITALWFSAVAARRLAAILLDLELVGRASVRRWRCRLHLDRFER
jgi:hypothetical protein